MEQNDDRLKEIIIEIERIKMQDKFEEAHVLIEKAIIQYSDDYRLYEEMADVSIYM
jgi:hypothetical protein